ncbi:hypothetical protein FACS1894178_4570 [Bacteroidia bacterium]|nr:hypothetical protein FACS1894178_4570 [Bacteroidia bacterium]
MNENPQNIKSALDDLYSIRNAIEYNTVYSSLSGLGFLLAGIITTVGYVYGFFFMNILAYFPYLILAAVIFCLSILSIFLCSFFKSREIGKKFIGTSTKKLFFNFLIPFVVGSFVILYFLGDAYFSPNAFYTHKIVKLVAGFSLLVYGMSLFSARKNMHKLFGILSYSELLLGLAALVTRSFEMAWFIWAFGFGVLHIVLGIALMLKLRTKN